MTKILWVRKTQFNSTHSPINLILFCQNNWGKNSLLNIGWRPNYLRHIGWQPNYTRHIGWRPNNLRHTGWQSNISRHIDFYTWQSIWQQNKTRIHARLTIKISLYNWKITTNYGFYTGAPLRWPAMRPHLDTLKMTNTICDPPWPHRPTLRHTQIMEQHNRQPELMDADTSEYLASISKQLLLSAKEI